MKKSIPSQKPHTTPSGSKSIKAKGLPEDLRLYLDRFREEAVKKFLAGQKEHGGDICDRHLNAEAYKEAIDLVFYLSAQRQKKQWILIHLSAFYSADKDTVTLPASAYKSIFQQIENL